MFNSKKMLNLLFLVNNFFLNNNKILPLKLQSTHLTGILDLSSLSDQSVTVGEMFFLLSQHFYLTTAKLFFSFDIAMKSLYVPDSFFLFTYPVFSCPPDSAFTCGSEPGQLNPDPQPLQVTFCGKANKIYQIYHLYQTRKNVIEIGSRDKKILYFHSFFFFRKVLS